MYPVAVVLQYTMQYNTILYNTQNNTYTLKTIHNTKSTNKITNTMHTKLQTSSFNLTSRIISITTQYYRKHENYKR